METIPKQHPGLFDYENRMKKLGEGPDPLARLNARIDWRMFRPDLEQSGRRRTKNGDRILLNLLKIMTPISKGGY